VGNPLDIRTCITQVTQALVETIDLGYRYRYPEVADLNALRTLPTTDDTRGTPDRALRFVVDQGVCYRFLLYSVQPHNPPSVVQPVDRPNNGRWVRTHSTVTLGPAYFRPLHRVRTGYARAIQRYQGEDAKALERIYAQRPAFLVEWKEDTYLVKSTVQGGIYEVNLQFSIHAMSQNLRPEQEALEGSQVASEKDPGLDRMIGDIRYLLAGSNLGLGPGIKYCDIQGNAQIMEQDLQQRIFTAEIPVLVRASVHREDEDLVPIEEVWVQEQIANTQGPAVFDKNNYVHKGYRIDWGGGFVATPAAGSAFVNGQLVASAPGAHTFTPNKDTYRDLGTDGILRYTEVNINDPIPTQDPNTLRIGLTRTDGSGISYDTLLAQTLEDYGDPFRIPKG
jgi:hypothetical protein